MSKTVSPNRIIRSVIYALVAILQAAQVQAKSPTEIFDQTSNSIVVVLGTDQSGGIKSLGSGVVVGPDKVITNCHVINNMTQLSIKHGGREIQARLIAGDRNRDVCLLSAPTLIARIAKIGKTGSLKVGHRVFAIGSPKGLDLTLSEGIIAGFRDDRHGRLIQISAPISQGSSGGGLFDSNGLLIGLPTFYLTGGQQLNFAVPSEWIEDVLSGNITPQDEPHKPYVNIDEQKIKLRCDGHKRDAVNIPGSMLDSALSQPQKISYLITIDKAKKTISSDPIFLLSTTDPKTDAVTSNSSALTETDAYYKAALPWRIRMADLVFKLHLVYNKYQIDRQTGELSYDVSYWHGDDGKMIYARYKAVLQCKPYEGPRF